MAQQPGLSQTRVNLALATLFLGTFVLGTAELGVVGMLNLIAGDMRVSISAAGTLVTAYALGLAIGGPILAALTIRVSRRLLLALTLAGYLAGTLLAALAADFGLFVAARALTGSAHGLFVGVAFTVAVSIVAPERTGRAMSVVLGGVAVSAALGVPLSTLIGQALGWRDAFSTIIVLGAVCLVATVAFIPPVPHTGAERIATQVRHALAPRVLAILGLGFLLFAGQYAAFTYIAPFLEQVTGVSGGLISVFLFAYGGATAVGVFAGGRFADHAASRTLIVGNAVLVVALGVLYLVGAVPILVAALLIVWGVFGLGVVPSLQYRVVSLAGPGRDIAATLPASAFNAGIAVGALAGGWAVAGYRVSSVFLVGLAICLLALAVACATHSLKPPPLPDLPQSPVPQPPIPQSPSPPARSLPIILERGSQRSRDATHRAAP